MKLIVPERLHEMTLGQLKGMSRADQWLQTDPQNRDYETFVRAFAKFLNVPAQTLDHTNQLTKNKLLTAFKYHSHAITLDYLHIWQTGAFTEMIVSNTLEDHEVLELEHKIKTRRFNLLYKKKLAANQKKFFCECDQLPTQIGIDLLDKLLPRCHLFRTDDHNFYKDWQTIPAVLAATYWGQKEDYYHYNEVLERNVVNMARINSMELLMEDVPAPDGVKAFIGFIKKKGLYSKDRNYSQCFEKWKAVVLLRPRTENDTQKNGAGAST